MKCDRTQLARRFAWQYYAEMLSAAAVAVVVGAASALATDGLAALPELVAWIAALLVGANTLGAVWIYSPIRRAVAGLGDSLPGLERRAHRLPLVSGFWILLLTATAMIGDAARGQGAFGGLGQESRAAVGVVIHCLVFAGYLGLYAYFLAVDHLVNLRQALAKQDLVLSLPRRKFASRVAAALFATALGPVLIALSDQWGHSASHVSSAPNPGALQAAQFLNQALHMDVLGALLLAGLVAALFARALSRPVDMLFDAMRRVDSGDFSARAPVVTDDEFGVLAERFNRMLDGLGERDRMRRAFTYFVPEGVAAALLADKGAIEPQEREATILFTDIERFSEIASRMAPREVLAMLNDYFGEIGGIVQAHGGVITQFQGDAVLASFNLPSADPRHARRAVQAALDIQRRIEEMTFRDGVRLRTRVGICTGFVVGGTVGGGERLGYTVHGDTVNLAARLEEHNKQTGTRILISARTASLLDGAITLRDLGETTLRGFDAPMRLFEPAVETEARN